MICNRHMVEDPTVPTCARPLGHRGPCCEVNPPGIGLRLAAHSHEFGGCSTAVLESEALLYAADRLESTGESGTTNAALILRQLAEDS